MMTNVSREYPSFFYKPISKGYVQSFYVLSTFTAVGMLIYIGVQNKKAINFVKHSGCFQTQEGKTTEACHYNIAGALPYITSAFCDEDSTVFDCDKFISYVKPSQITVISLMAFISFVVAISAVHAYRKINFDSEKNKSERTPMLHNL